MKRSINRVSPHQQIVDILRKEIADSHAVGERLPGENALAKSFGVSHVTVAKALAVLEREGLIERKTGSGTYVTDQSAHQHVALWMASPRMLPQTSYWSLRILDQVRLRLSGEGLRFKIYWSDLEQDEQCHGIGYEEFLQDLSHHAIAAVALIQGWWGDTVEKLIRKTRVPVVYPNPLHNPRVLAAGVDPVAMVREGAGRLLQQGCRRIAWIAYGGVGQTTGAQPTPLREAFRAVLAESGVAVRDGWIRGDLYPNWPGAGYEEFREIWAAAPEKPDGLLVSDDVLLPDVAVAIRELGITVPGQLQVVATAIKGVVSCPSFPAERMEYDPDLVAAARAAMLVKLVRRQPIAPRQVLVPFRWFEAGAAGLAGASSTEVPTPTDLQKPNDSSKQTNRRS